VCVGEVHTQTHTNTRAHIHIHAHTHTHTYRHTHPHTHTHKRIHTHNLQVDPKYKALIEATYRSLEEAIQHVKPGTRYFLLCDSVSIAL
jgi:hypothetical protein